MEEREKIINYIRNNFNTDITTICLIENIYDYLDNHSCSLSIITYNDNRIAIHSFLYDLLEILESSRIDLTMQELLDNNLIDTECR